MYAGEFAPVIGDGGYGCGSVGGRGRVSVDRGEDAAYFGVEELGAAVWHSHRHRLLAVPSGFPGPGVDVLKDVGVDPLQMWEVEVAGDQVGVSVEFVDSHERHAAFEFS